MFLGTHEHALDAKGRVILPSKFRDQLEGGAYVTKGLERCLVVFPAAEFQRVADEMTEKMRRGPAERAAARAFFSGTAEATPDRQGRISIPQHLRRYAGLQEQVVVNGVWTRIEIWDAATWAEVNGRGDQGLADAVPELDDIGI